jgi:GntR family transcriptional regulator
VFVFRIDSSSGVPPYLQLVQQVRQAVLLGFLKQGDRLPLIREVAETVAINPNTVAKAYRQLEQEGLVTGRPGQGTFVNETPAATISPATYTSLQRGLETWLDRARAAGLDEQAINALFTSALNRAKNENIA